MYGPTLLVPAWYRDAAVKKVECVECTAGYKSERDAHYAPEWPWCPVCKHNVRKYGIGDLGKRFGTSFCDVVAGCHGKVDVLKIEWDHHIDGDPLDDPDLKKRISSLTFFMDTYGDGDHVASKTMAPTVG